MKTLSTLLFKQVRPEIEINITANINEKGDLLIEGHDFGKLVEELRGSWDYEYFLTVPKPQKEMLREKLGEELETPLEDQELLKWLEKSYNHNEAFSGIEQLLDRLGVRYEFHSWG